MNHKKEVVDLGIMLLERRLTAETWGNISLRDPETGKVYLTPSAMKYDEIKEDDIVVCDLDGNIIEGSRKPTIEKDLHVEIYRKRDDVNAVIHTHAEDSLVFACLGETIPLIMDEAAQTLYAPVKTAEYALPGTKELAENCVRCLEEDAMACMLRSHGAVCLGKDGKQAIKTAAVLEITARIYAKAKMLGEVKPLKESDIDAMKDFVRNAYGQDK